MGSESLGKSRLTVEFRFQLCSVQNNQDYEETDTDVSEVSMSPIKSLHDC